MSRELNPSRREFTKTALAAGAIPLLGGGAAAPVELPALSAESELDAAVRRFQARFGGRLTPEQIADLRQAIRGNLEAAEELRIFALDGW